MDNRIVYILMASAVLVGIVIWEVWRRRRPRFNAQEWSGRFAAHWTQGGGRAPEYRRPRRLDVAGDGETRRTFLLAAHLDESLSLLLFESRSDRSELWAQLALSRNSVPEGQESAAYAALWRAVQSALIAFFPRMPQRDMETFLSSYTEAFMQVLETLPVDAQENVSRVLDMDRMRIVITYDPYARTFGCQVNRRY